MDILKGLREAGYTPEVIEDDLGFAPINGRYVARIDSAGRVGGTSKRTGKDYDFRTIKLQVVEVIDGDKAMNRRLDLVYNIDEEGTKKLLNDLFTSGIEITATTDEKLDIELPMLTDKTMNIRCWVWTPEQDRQGNAIPVEQRKAYQQTRVVKEFKGKKKADTVKSNVPF